MVLMSSAFLVPVMDHMSVCCHFRAKIPILEQISMKRPQRSRISSVGHFLVLLQKKFEKKFYLVTLNCDV